MYEAILDRQRSEYQLALDKALNDVLGQLRAMPQVERVILFGSYASGRRDLFTDLDLLVVVNTEKNIIERTTELYSQIKTDVDLDLLVYTQSEIDNHQDSGFLRHILATGQVLYEK